MTPESYSRSAGTLAILAGLFVSSVGVGSDAHAQAWLPDRTYTEGPGIRVGDVELHPGVAVRGGYDTNVFKADGKRRTASLGGQQVDVTQEQEGSAILAVTPHLYLSTLSEQRRTQGEDRDAEQRSLPSVAFRGGIAATYFHYFVDRGPKNLEIDTDLWLGILPQRPVNVDLSIAYVRNVRPFTQNAFNRNAYVFDAIQPRARINFGSRSQVLTAYVGYAPRIMLFESDVFNYLNSFTHGVEAGAAWKFLPNTALIYDATLDFQRFSEKDPETTVSPVVFADGTRFKNRLGINGSITRRLALRGLAGYGVVALSNSRDAEILDDHEDVIGEAALTWHFGPAQTSQFEIGYQRDLLSSIMGGWTRLDRGFLSLSAVLGRVFLLSIQGGVSGVTYGRLWGYDQNTMGEAAGRDPGVPVPLGAGNTVKRTDIRLDAGIHGEYRITNWLSLLADVSTQAIVTDFEYALYFSNSPVPDPAEYFAVTAFGGVRAHY